MTLARKMMKLFFPDKSSSAHEPAEMQHNSELLQLMDHIDRTMLDQRVIAIKDDGMLVIGYVISYHCSNVGGKLQIKYTVYDVLANQTIEDLLVVFHFTEQRLVRFGLLLPAQRICIIDAILDPQTRRSMDYMVGDSKKFDYLSALRNKLDKTKFRQYESWLLYREKID